MTKKKQSFEESLAQLENVVGKMELMNVSTFMKKEWNLPIFALNRRRVRNNAVWWRTWWRNIWFWQQGPFL